MKKLIYLFPVLILLIFHCAMPSQVTDTAGSNGRITLISEVNGENTQEQEGSQRSARSISPEDADRVIISIENADTLEIVYDNYELTLYNLNGQFISESLELATGEYNLTTYLVVDDTANVIFVAPLEGAPLAGLVSDPLPITFEVYNNVTTSINVEVLPTEHSAAEDFGYSIFSFDINYADLVYPDESIIRSYNAGSDGILDTLDDEVVSVTRQTYKDFYSDNWQKFFDDPGADQIWLTADDEAYGWWWNRFDYGGSFQNGPGNDGVWFTTDDEISSWTEWTNPNIERSYINPGDDGEWFTADDIMDYYCVKEYDSLGNEIKRVFYDDAGVDGIWETADDQIGVGWLGAYIIWKYEGEYNTWNTWTRQIVYIGAGADGEWFTADDEVRDWKIHEFDDGTKFFTRENTFQDAGADGIMFTEDDILAGYRTAENTY